MQKSLCFRFSSTYIRTAKLGLLRNSQIRTRYRVDQPTGPNTTQVRSCDLDKSPPFVVAEANEQNWFCNSKPPKTQLSIFITKLEEVRILMMDETCAQHPAILEGRAKLKLRSAVTQNSLLVNCRDGKCKSVFVFDLSQPIFTQ